VPFTAGPTPIAGRGKITGSDAPDSDLGRIDEGAHPSSRCPQTAVRGTGRKPLPQKGSVGLLILSDVPFGRELAKADEVLPSVHLAVEVEIALPPWRNHGGSATGGRQIHGVRLVDSLSQTTISKSLNVCAGKQSSPCGKSCAPL
jgi:hypothetical protein